jgi:hypothetical protein
MSTIAPLAPDTSWGRAAFFDVSHEIDEAGQPVDVREYMGTGWTVCCLRHEKTTDVWDELQAVETVAVNPDQWCEGCEQELAAWLRRQPPPEPTDLDADSHREIAGIRARERAEREGRESAESPEGHR